MKIDCDGIKFFRLYDIATETALPIIYYCHEMVSNISKNINCHNLVKILPLLWLAIFLGNNYLGEWLYANILMKAMIINLDDITKQEFKQF